MSEKNEFKNQVELTEEDLEDAVGGTTEYTKNNYSADCARRTKPEPACNDNSIVRAVWCDHFRRLEYAKKWMHYCGMGCYVYWTYDEHGREPTTAPEGYGKPQV